MLKLTFYVCLLITQDSPESDAEREKDRKGERENEKDRSRQRSESKHKSPPKKRPGKDSVSLFFFLFPFYLMNRGLVSFLPTTGQINTTHS